MLLKRLMICILIISSFLLYAGIDNNVLVHTDRGPVQMKVVKIGDKILCTNMKTLSIEERRVSAIQRIDVEEIVEITTSDSVVFRVAPEQKLFVSHKWVNASHLNLEDVLLTKNREMVSITGIRRLKQPTMLSFITVDEHHNFLAAENGVLIHNGPILGLVGYWATKIICYGAATAGVVSTVVYAPTIAVTVGAKATALATSLGATSGTATAVGATVSGVVSGTANVITSAPAVGAKGAFLLGAVTNTAPVVATTVTATVTGTATATTLGTAAITATPGSASIATAVANAGWLGCVVAKVESVSVTVGAFLATLPTP